ncbi:MAG: ANTAR domain-containing protein [Firmicutes bacterium]|nr:ANTAR domain-containing protein [Bacillota bacterium]
MSEIRVVLVDNDVSWQKNLKSILQKVGCLVVGEAEDGLTAIKIIRARQPDIAIIEASVPVKDGVEVAKIINEDRLAPVVLTSANYRQELLDNAINAGVKGFLVKPIDESSLIPAIEIALSTYHEMDQLERNIKKLEDKLESRKLIEKAKGILMETMGLSEKQAFQRLQKQSMNKRVSMRAVAEAIIMAHNLQNDI